MPRRDRSDAPGALHHVYNRALARRTMFESRRDMRAFLALLACRCRRREIKILAYCLLSTHFHLFVQSLEGRLDEVMQWVQTGYSRYFNRSRRRDGPLVRGRFASRLVDSSDYAWALRSYIEWNPVQAGVVDAPEDYEFGSAYASWRDRSPPWLERFGDQGVGRSSAAARYSRESLDALGAVIEARLLGRPRPAHEEFPARPTTESLRRWMLRKAELADGTAPGEPVCDPETVVAAVLARSEAIESATRVSGKRGEAAVRAMLCGQLRDLCGLRLDQIGAKVGRATSTAAKSISVHRQRLLAAEAYANLAAAIAIEAIRRFPIRLFEVEEMA